MRCMLLGIVMGALFTGSALAAQGSEVPKRVKTWDEKQAEKAALRESEKSIDEPERDAESGLIDWGFHGVDFRYTSLDYDLYEWGFFDFDDPEEAYRDSDAVEYSLRVGVARIGPFVFGPELTLTGNDFNLDAFSPEREDQVAFGISALYEYRVSSLLDDLIVGWNMGGFSNRLSSAMLFSAKGTVQVVNRGSLPSEDNAYMRLALEAQIHFGYWGVSLEASHESSDVAAKVIEWRFSLGRPLLPVGVFLGVRSRVRDTPRGDVHSDWLTFGVEVTF